MDRIDETSLKPSFPDPLILNNILLQFIDAIPAEKIGQLAEALNTRSDLVDIDNAILLLHILQLPALREKDLSICNMVTLALLNGRNCNNVVAMLMEIAFDSKRSGVNLMTLLLRYPTELKFEDLMQLHKSLYAHSLSTHSTSDKIWVAWLADELRLRAFNNNVIRVALILHKLSILSYMAEADFFVLIEQIWAIKFKDFSARDTNYLGLDKILDILYKIEKIEKEEA